MYYTDPCTTTLMHFIPSGAGLCTDICTTVQSVLICRVQRDLKNNLWCLHFHN